MNHKLRPMQNKILVRAIEQEEKYGRIIIPDNARESSVEGKVVAVGNGKINKRTGEIIPLKVKIGNNILYGKYSGIDIVLNGEKLLLMREDDVLGILSEN